MTLPLAAYMPAHGRPKEVTPVWTLLAAMGIPPRIIKSFPDRVPTEIRSLTSYQDFPARPFGLVGESGVGKSSAFASAIRSLITDGATLEFRWVGWVSTAIRMKNAASRREWDSPEASTFALIEWVQESPTTHILIMDDLGMEFPKAAKADGDPTRGWVYTSEQLELLVDEAWNHEARLYWTSQREVEELEQLYGSRLMSRLVGLSPDARLPKGMPDLRVRGGV